MVKFVLVVVFVTNLILIVSSTGSGQSPYEKSENSSSSSSSNSSSIGSSGTTNDGDTTVIQSETSASDNETSCGGDKNAKPGCGINCGKLCSNYDKGPVSCITLCKVNGCDCKEEFVYDENIGYCVSPEQCTPTCGANEQFDGCINGGCYSARTCEDLDILNGTTICKDVVAGGCIPGCLCMPGYLRDDNGDCIPENTCPNSKCKNANETFVQCVSDCQVETCDQVGYGTICQNPGDNSCEAKCICRDNLVRDKDGVCIPQDQCPTCGGDPNAQPGCGVNCRKLCSDYNHTGPIFCSDICEVNSCDCKEGYFFDRNLKKCVQPNECKPVDYPPFCNSDEVFDSCANGGCYSARKCSDLERNGTTICVDVTECIPGCLCKNGYLKNDEGKCIPENTCPNSKCKNANETFVQCVSDCQVETCDQVGYGTICQNPGDHSCEAKCVCRDNLVRDKDGVCIPQDQCPTCGGDPNAQPGCGINCGKLCSDYNHTGPIVCPDVCEVNGCDCKDGYYFDRNLKKCVEPNQCSECINGNETYFGCPSSPPGCSPQTCDDVGEPAKPCVAPLPGQCMGPAACYCLNGYVRNENGECVAISDCPSCGGDPNARSVACGGNCGRRCSDLNKGPVACTLQCQVNACSCIKGYVYDDVQKKCVPPGLCATECGQNEEYSSCTNGGCFGARNCSEVGHRPYVCVKIDPRYCKIGCVCKEGYVKNDNGVCIPVKECQANEQCTGPNEFYDDCPPNCPPQNCSSIGHIYHCPLQPAVCKPACRCVSGYFRNEDNICISQAECAKSCPKDEVYNDCVNGGCFGARNCSEIGIGTKCVKLAAGACKGGCLCRDGYLRDDQGICVLEEQCQCKANEEYEICPTRCPARQCGIDDRLVFCPKQPVPGDPNCPPPTCRCKSGFYNNTYGECVTWKKCSQCKKNEVYDLCPSDCPPRRCGINDAAVSCAPVPQLGDPECAKPRCRCQDGYYKNDQGDCVTLEECQTCSGSNEVYDDCPPNCPPQTCSSIGHTYNCPLQPAVCEPACRCVSGYYRNDDNICVSAAECAKCTQPNEAYVNCPDTCVPNTCESIGKKYNCPFQPADGNKTCNGECRCKSGYFRNKIGECVSRENCLQCTGANEEWNLCPYTCPPQTCEAIGKVYACPAQSPKYQDCEGKGSCRCIPGYYRNKINVCTSEENCLKCTKPHEYYFCGGACDNVCSNLSKQNQTNCPIINIKCNDMCYCEEGYARDNDGNCVLFKDCPKTCTGSNEVYDDCPPNCPPQTCSSIGHTYNCPLQPAVCKPACRCAKGYYRYEDNLCVAQADCPPKCNVNEEYSTCTQAICRTQECSKKGQPVACPRVKEGYCIKGCVCKENFLKAENGTCIPEDQCPPVCPDNGVYNTCPPRKCDAEYCPKSRNDPQSCVSPRNCGKPRCTCRFDEKRDRKTEKCIAITSCPPFKCGHNEEYDSCPAGCPGETCKDYVNKTKCPPYRIGIVVPCKPACKCTKDHYRNSKGICVKAKQCLKEVQVNNTTTATTTTPTPVDTNTPYYPTESGDSGNVDGQAKLSRGINDFAVRTIQQVASLNPKQNAIISPWSIQVLLAELSLFTNGTSRQQLLNALGLSSQDEVRTEYKKSLETFTGGNGVTFDTVFRNYINKEYPISKNFNTTAQEVFNASAENIDCSQPQIAAKQINDFVALVTNDRIQNLISENLINKLTRSILINAIYFKGAWQTKFNKKDTENKDFYVDNTTTIQVPTMYLETKLDYFKSSDLEAQVARLYFNNTDFSYIIVLPEDKFGLDALLNKLTGDSLTTAVNSMSMQKCKLWMPSYKIESSYQLTDMLKAMGITNIFEAGNSGIVGILKKAADLYVSAFVQKAFIETNEEGSEAAAATGILVGATAAIENPPPIPEIRCDHPFLIAIYSRDKIVFTTIYRNNNQ